MINKTNKWSMDDMQTSVLSSRWFSVSNSPHCLCCPSYCGTLTVSTAELGAWSSGSLPARLGPAVLSAGRPFYFEHSRSPGWEGGWCSLPSLWTTPNFKQTDSGQTTTMKKKTSSCWSLQRTEATSFWTVWSTASEVEKVELNRTDHYGWN